MSGVNFRVESSGFYEFAAHVLTRAAMTGTRVQAGLAESVEKLKGVAEANSSGRPGPNIITGSYHDSWFTAVGDGEGVVANFQVQALRLEFGFVGVDSLGRHYNQPPYAHLGPAVQTFGPEFGAIMARALRS